MPIRVAVKIRDEETERQSQPFRSGMTVSIVPPLSHTPSSPVSWGVPRQNTVRLNPFDIKNIRKRKIERGWIKRVGCNNVTSVAKSVRSGSVLKFRTLPPIEFLRRGGPPRRKIGQNLSEHAQP